MLKLVCYDNGVNLTFDVYKSSDTKLRTNLVEHIENVLDDCSEFITQEQQDKIKQHIRLLNDIKYFSGTTAYDVDISDDEIIELLDNNSFEIYDMESINDCFNFVINSQNDRYTEFDECSDKQIKNSLVFKLALKSLD
jgi:hypothetical protein